MTVAEKTNTKVVLLNDGHAVENFDCGKPVRNSWLCRRAFSNQRTDDTRTYVALQDSNVVGFHAVAVSSIVHAGLPAGLRRNAPEPISCVLLAQLAVDKSMQRQGIGRMLILHAMEQAAKIAELAGCRLFTVHPDDDDVIRYYQRIGFVSVDVSPAMMAMSMKQVRRTLETAKARAESALHS